MPFQYDQYVQAQDGYDLVLTIDETAQSIVEKHLQAGLEACCSFSCAFFSASSTFSGMTSSASCEMVNGSFGS